MNLCKSDRVLRRGYVEEQTHKTPSYMGISGILTLLQTMLCLLKSSKALILTYATVELLRTRLRVSTAELLEHLPVHHCPSSPSYRSSILRSLAMAT